MNLTLLMRGLVKSVVELFNPRSTPITLTQIYIMKPAIRSELKKLGVIPDALQRLARLLDGLVKGSDDIFVTPIANNRTPESILRGWDSIFNANTDKLNDVLLDLEETNRIKFGPRSIAVPWSMRRAGVLNSFSSGIEKTVEWRPPVYGRFRPIDKVNATKYIKRQTNAGLPTLLKKGAILFSGIGQIPGIYPAVPFTRTQENKKARIVWGVPLADVLDEMQFYRPILMYQRDVPWRAALRSADEIDVALTKLINHSVENDLQLLSIDFETFDDTVKYALQNWAFTVYFASLFQSKYAPDLNRHFQRFNTIGLVTPDGILTGSHGIPSGSAYTNEVGSVVQHGVARDFYESMQFDQQQGDDGAYAVSDPEGLKDHFRSYGLKVNDEKSYIADDYIIYLQNLYHTDYKSDGLIRGIYPTYRALLRIVYQERFNDFSEDKISGKDYYAIRTLSILENCKHHPLFRELVKYVVKLDKFDLDVSDQGISAYVRMREKQDGKDVRFTEYKRGDGLGIKSFESYKLAREFSGK